MQNIVYKSTEPGSDLLSAVRKSPQASYIFYHANCLDGLVAASIARRAYEYNGYPQVSATPVRYGDMGFLADIKEGSEVLFVDFSLPPADLMQLITTCKPTKLRVVDHHLTFIRQLQENDHGLFDITKTKPTLVEIYLSEKGGSGASMCAELFRCDLLSDEELQLVELTRTFDLWEHGGDTSHDASYLAAYMSLVIATTKTTPKNDYKVRSPALGLPLSTILAIGKQEQEKLEDEADQVVETTGLGILWPNGLRIMTVNAEASLFPTICNRYKKEVDFFLFWRNNTADRQPSKKHGYKGSLRAGRKTDMDLSSLAARLDAEGKGGGHKDAAGFSSFVPMHELLAKEFGKGLQCLHFPEAQARWRAIDIFKAALSNTPSKTA